MSLVLTPSGYVDVASLSVGDSVSAFDITTGAQITNTVESIKYIDEVEWTSWWKPMVDNGELSSTPSFKFYRINGTWTLNSEQSIWYSRAGELNVTHVRDLQLGDVLYDDTDQPFTITSLDEATSDGWYRFDISGDHSYIVDGLTLHNASRFAVNAGNVAWTWDLSATTHWSALSNGSAGASAPGSADAVTFDGSSGGNVVTPGYGGTGTFQSITCGAFTGTIDWSTNNNSVVLSATTGFSGSGAGTRTIKLGSITMTLSASSGNPLLMTTTTGLTFDAGTSIIDFSGALTATQSLTLGGLNYSTVKISGSRLNFRTNLTGTGSVIGLFVVSAPANIQFGSSMTFTNTQITAQFSLTFIGTLTLALTNAPTLQSGAESAVSSILATNGGPSISLTTGALSLNWIAVGGVNFTGGASWTFNKSFDLGANSASVGSTITFNPPKYISRSRGHYLAEAA